MVLVDGRRNGCCGRGKLPEPGGRGLCDAGRHAGRARNQAVTCRSGHRHNEQPTCHAWDHGLDRPGDLPGGLAPAARVDPRHQGQADHLPRFARPSGNRGRRDPAQQRPRVVLGTGRQRRRHRPRAQHRPETYQPHRSTRPARPRNRPSASPAARESAAATWATTTKSTATSSTTTAGTPWTTASMCQNTARHTVKRFVDNIVFENAGCGFHLYGQSPQLSGLYLEGNISFATSLNPRCPSKGEMNILTGGSKPITHLRPQDQLHVPSQSRLEAQRRRWLPWFAQHRHPHRGQLLHLRGQCHGAQGRREAVVRNNTFWARPAWWP